MGEKLWDIEMSYLTTFVLHGNDNFPPILASYTVRSKQGVAGSYPLHNMLGS